MGNRASSAITQSLITHHDLTYALSGDPGFIYSHLGVFA